jgi:hypothetical protein
MDAMASLAAADPVHLGVLSSEQDRRRARDGAPIVERGQHGGQPPGSPAPSEQSEDTRAADAAQAVEVELA